MIPSDIKQRICKLLVKNKSFDTLEKLKRVSKEWCYIVLSIQWSKYSNERGLAWYAFSDSNFDTGVSRLDPGEKVGSVFQNAFVEYGRYFVKHMEFNHNIDDDQNYKFPKIKCLKLKSFSAIGSKEMLQVLPKHIEMYPNITDIFISFEKPFGYYPDGNLSDSRLPLVDDSVLRNFNPQHLKHLKLVRANVHVPNISYTFDQLPNLVEFETKNLILDDISDILEIKDANTLMRETKQYPNVAKFAVSNFFTPKSNPQALQMDQVTLDPMRLFPKVAALKVNPELYLDDIDSFHDMIRLKHRELPQFPLPSVSKLIVNRIDTEIISNLKTNCPYVREFSMEDFSEETEFGNYNTMQIISQSFPNLIRFEFNPGGIRGRNVEEDHDINDSLLFQQSPETQIALMNNPMAASDELGLSFEIPLDFNWPHLREVALCEYWGFSSKVFFVLSQFENLEKLKLDFCDLSGVDVVKRRIIGQAAKENQKSASRPKWFPKLWHLSVHIRNSSVYLVDDCVDFVEHFPALKRIQVSFEGLEEGEAWEETREKLPHIDWDLELRYMS